MIDNALNKGRTMAKVMHISYRAEDVDAMANRSRRAGLDHIGFSAEDGQEQIRRIEAAGATEESTQSPYEKKFKGPEGIIIDVGRWPGSAPLEK